MIALVDYNMGNLLSVSKALEAVGGEIRLVDKADELEKFDSIILPGVGHFGDGMENLRSRGFEAPLKKASETGKNILGICLGMQMMLESSEEAPGVEGLALFKGKVLRFPQVGEKVPHMGWNNVKIKNMHPLMKGVPDESYFYFVHSYYVAVDDPACTIGSCEYINEFTAIIGKNNVCGTQFHPEKSQKYGLIMLKNFVKNSQA
ncbi:MAG: imidazole glycerol phosphate synthase subunit HisH [Victivallales bacterium]|nr:imidazole glycerol phosphate synthase subunit HisH [Victivallales bacterium]